MSPKIIPHFRFYPRDFIEGVQGMQRGDIGDYIRILAGLYEHEGAIDFDIHKLRFLLDCRPCDVGKRIHKLIRLGKIYVADDGKLHNTRVDTEMCLRAEWRANHPQMTPSALPEKPTKTTRARHARPVTDTDNNLFSSAPYVQAAQKKSTCNGGAAMAGSPAIGGRSPATPPEETLTADEIALIQGRLSFNTH